MHRVGKLEPIRAESSTPKLKSAPLGTIEACSAWTGRLPDIAFGVSYRNAWRPGVPTVVGMDSLEQAHETVRVWREIVLDARIQERKEYEDQVIRVFHGYRNLS